MRAVCLKHVPFEGPGAFAGHLAGRGVSIERFLVPTDGLPDDPGDLLIVMGGPMSVNDTDPWISEETRFIRRAIDRGTPVLGVCLGSQLMAKALGASVKPGQELEIGMTSIRLTEDGTRDPVFGTFPDVFEVFQWHGEIFDLPPGAVPLAGSALAPLQAFRYGSCAYGLLFHLEMDEPGMDALCRECAQDLARADLTYAQLVNRARPQFARLHEWANRLLDHLLLAPR